MAKRIIAFFIFLLFAVQVSAYWDENCLRRQVNITVPAYDLNKNVLALGLVDLTSGFSQLDLNKFHLVYEPTDTETRIATDGNISLTDANIYFDANHMVGGSGTNNDYAMYYGDSCPVRSIGMTTEREQFDAFEDNELDNNGTWAEGWSDGGTTAVQNTVVKNGSYALRIQTESEGNQEAIGVKHPFNEIVGDFNFSVWFRTDSNAQMTNGIDIRLVDTLGQQVNNIRVNSVGVGSLEFWRAKQFGVLSTTIAEDTWYRFEFDADGNGSVYRIFDSSNILLETAACDSNGGVIRAELVAFDDLGSAVNFYFDDITMTPAPRPTFSIEEESPIGRLQMHFTDENTGATITPTTVTINGASQTVTNGLLFYDFTGAIKDYTVLASMASYTQRQWFWADVNQLTDIDINVTLLQTSMGVNMDFNFSAPNQYSSLVNTVVELRKPDINVSSRIKTDASGELTFFLNNTDRNYFFRIYDTNGEVYDYNVVIAKFNVPKDDDTSTNITPYNVTVKGVGGNIEHVAYTTPTFLYMLPNTKENYELDLNAGSAYTSSTKEVSYKGNPQTDTIQMYATATAESVTATIYTKDAVDLSVEPGIQIDSYRFISGEGTVLIESVTTDDAGIAIMSFRDGVDYTLKVYDVASNFLFEKDITADTTITTYYIYIGTDDVTDWEVSGEYIVVKIAPTTGYLKYGGAGVDVNVTIDTNGTISTSWMWVSNADGNLDFNVACGTGCGFTIPYADLVDVNLGKSITVSVWVVNSSGLVRFKILTFVPIETGSTNLLLLLTSAKFRTEWGCSADANEPCFFLLMVSAMLTIGMVASVQSTGVTGSSTSLGIVALIGIGLFTYLTWVPTVIFIISALAVLASLILTRREF